MRKEFEVAMATFFIACILMHAASYKVSSEEMKDISKEKIYISYEIQSGDTLTSLASKYNGAYINDEKWIDEVIFINHLDDAAKITEGSYIVLPTWEN